ncbi:PH domain-containing protein [Priestia megaterium]|nr:PH domain-containing protein [Priestia megaterium]
MEIEHLTGKLPEEAKKAMRLQALFGHVLWLLGTIGYFLLVYFFDWWSWIMWGSLGLLVISFIVYVVVAPNIYMKVYSYELTETHLEVQRGLFIWHHTKIPIVKVQHVETSTGPILRKYNLASISVITAAGSVEFPALKAEDAAKLREQIAKMAEVDDQDE